MLYRLFPALATADCRLPVATPYFTHGRSSRRATGEMASSDFGRRHRHSLRTRRCWEDSARGVPGWGCWTHTVLVTPPPSPVGSSGIRDSDLLSARLTRPNIKAIGGFVDDRGCVGLPATTTQSFAIFPRSTAQPLRKKHVPWW